MTGCWVRVRRKEFSLSGQFSNGEPEEMRVNALVCGSLIGYLLFQSFLTADNFTV